jgi:hypothetical protein
MASPDVAALWGTDVAEKLAAMACPALYAVTPDYCRQLPSPTATFLCPISSNTFGIDFCSFRVRSIHDHGGSTTLFEVSRPDSVPAPPIETLNDSSRFIRYHFGPEFLDVRTVATQLEFQVNCIEPLNNFLMIERHYFRDQLIQSYEFSMPFVPPGTKNTWEMIYANPFQSSDEATIAQWKAALTTAPWEAKSDSFYFVDALDENGQMTPKLVMQNRAEYNYGPKA